MQPRDAIVRIGKLVALWFVGLWLAGGAASAEIRRLEYEGFTVWVDCDRRGPIRFHYIAHPDRGSLPRHGSYVLDPDVPDRCQSTSTKVLGTKRGIPYDVGHQVPANHFDHSALAIRQTNFWTNLLPQTASMNRGAWLATEYLIECIRDEVPLEVWGGAIWGPNAKKDFVRSHGIETPTAFWKVVIRTDNREAMAWVVPNGKAPPKSLNRWLKSVADVEELSGRTFHAVSKETKPAASWKRPKGCKTS